MTTTRVTITLPPELVHQIDMREKNRSRFILEAVTRELERRREEELRRSLDSPHPEAVELAEAGFSEWGAQGSPEDAEALLVRDAGREVRWMAGRGWVEAAE